MNRRQFLVGIIVLSVLILLIRPDILGALFALLFLGLVPGTAYSLPSVLMFVIYGIIAILVIYWLAHQPMYIGNKSRQEKTARTLARKKVLNKKKTAPKKRRPRKKAKA